MPQSNLAEIQSPYRKLYLLPCFLYILWRITPKRIKRIIYLALLGGSYFGLCQNEIKIQNKLYRKKWESQVFLEKIVKD